MKITRVGVDLAKSVFKVHGVDGAGRRVWKRQLKRSSWLSVLTETVEQQDIQASHGLWEDLQGLDQRLKVLDKEILMLPESHPDANKRLKQLRGIGPLTPQLASPPDTPAPGARTGYSASPKRAIPTYAVS